MKLVDKLLEKERKCLHFEAAMKGALLSIKPKDCELIANRKMTIKVLKSHPKIDTPFKCYIYCTIGNGVKGDYLVPSGIQCGKVIGEFVCDKVQEFTPCAVRLCGLDYNICVSDFFATSMTDQELNDYGKDKPLYGWHISDLKVYDKPKELREFKRWNRTEENAPCAHTKWLYPDCKDCKECNLTRPPQSWCYVESLGE